MIILELFAGQRCIGKAAEALGHTVYSIDWADLPGLYKRMDIGGFKESDIPHTPDHVHASFDCKTYTISAISKHRNGIIPKSEYAVFCDEVNQHVLFIIASYKKKNPMLTFSIENPRGMLRKMPWMQGLPRHTVWYCQYGDDRAKPTDIWTDIPGWTPRPQCHNGNKDCHHQPAPRGSRTGTQGRKNSEQRSLIPEALCRELIEARQLDEI